MGMNMQKKTNTKKMNTKTNEPSMEDIIALLKEIKEILKTLKRQEITGEEIFGGK